MNFNFLSTKCIFVLICGISTTSYAATLTGNQIQEKIIGHEISGIEDGVSYTEKFLPNGTIVGKESNNKYTGKWKINNNKLCIIFDDDDDDEWECNSVSISGNKITWHDSEGGPDEYSTLK